MLREVTRIYMQTSILKNFSPYWTICSNKLSIKASFFHFADQISTLELLKSLCLDFWVGAACHSIQNWIEDLYWKQLDLEYPGMPDNAMVCCIQKFLQLTHKLCWSKEC